MVHGLADLSAEAIKLMNRLDDVAGPTPQCPARGSSRFGLRCTLRWTHPQPQFSCFLYLMITFLGWPTNIERFSSPLFVMKLEEWSTSVHPLHKSHDMAGAHQGVFAVHNILCSCRNALSFPVHQVTISMTNCSYTSSHH